MVRYIAAVTLKASTQWSTLTSAQQAEVQGYIDAGATLFVADL